MGRESMRLNNTFDLCHVQRAITDHLTPVCLVNQAIVPRPQHEDPIELTPVQPQSTRPVTSSQSQRSAPIRKKI